MQKPRRLCTGVALSKLHCIRDPIGRRRVHVDTDPQSHTRLVIAKPVAQVIAEKSGEPRRKGRANPTRPFTFLTQSTNGTFLLIARTGRPCRAPVACPVCVRVSAFWWGKVPGLGAQHARSWTPSGRPGLRSSPVGGRAWRALVPSLVIAIGNPTPVTPTLTPNPTGPDSTSQAGHPPAPRSR